MNCILFNLFCEDREEIKNEAQSDRHIEQIYCLINDVSYLINEKKNTYQ